MAAVPAAGSLTVAWAEIFIVFLCSHLAGDFLLQTEFQALNKFGGLSGGLSFRALAAHSGSYLLAFLPALLWLAGSHGGGELLGLAALLVGPHFLQDDGRLVSRYSLAVKHSVVAPGELLFIAVDQSFHVLALLGVALLAGS